MPALATSAFAPLGRVPFAILFVWLCLALGRRSLHALGASGGQRGERALVALSIGAGWLALLTFSLGAVGALSVRNLAIAIALLSLPLLPDLVAVVRAGWRTVAELRAPDRWVSLGLVALLPALGVAWMLALGPTTDPDGLSYHLTVPKRWLLGGSLEYLPTYPYSNTPMGAEMLFMLGLAFAGDSGAKIIHFLFGCASGLGLWYAGVRLRGPTTGLLAAFRYLVGPLGVAALLGLAYIEGVTSCALVTAVLAWLIWFRERSPGWLRAAALLSGIAVSYKQTAALFPVTLAALTLLTLHHDERRPSLASSLGVLGKLVPFVMGPVLPWVVRAVIVTGNPVFPMFASVIPSRDFSAQHSAQFDEYNRYMVWAGEMGVNWTLLQRKLLLLAFAVTIMAFAAFLFVRARTRFARGTIVILAVATLVQTLGVGLYARYWLPVLAVLQLPLLAYLEEGFFVRRAGRLALVGFTLLGSLLQVKKMLSDLKGDAGGLVRTTLGTEDRRTFLARHVQLYPLYEVANRTTPRNSAVLLSNYCGGFYIDRTTYCAEFVQDSLRTGTWEAFVEDARRLGITHVVAPRTLATGGPPPPIGFGNTSVIVRPDEFVVLARLLSTRGRLIDSAADQGLYAVDLLEAEPPAGPSTIAAHPTAD